MVSKNYIKASIVFLACLINLSCQERENDILHNGSTEHIIVASLETDKSKASFFTDESLNLLCRWDGTERLNVYYRQASGEYSSYVADALISDVGEDRLTAQFTYTPDKKWNVNNSDSYETAVFTLNCFPTLDPATGSIHLDARLLRQSLKNFGLSVYYAGESSGGKTKANFVHYYTYELLHIRNSSGKKIDFSLNGFEATPIWFKRTASYCIDNGASDNKSWTGINPVDMSAPVPIEPQSTEIIVSAYIPTGYNIKDATMVATIDGEAVHSINKISSDIDLRKGHAYHMYAEWDGKELKFVGSTPVEDTNEPVDLGLSVKWASFNVGAKKPEEYGDYYAWGELDTYYEPGYAQTSSWVWKSGKTMGYSWKSYKWCDGSSTTLTKYNYDAEYGDVDGLRILQLEDDAANVKWGGNWQMPSEEDFEELLDKCTSEWTSRNGVNGLLLTSKTNGNSIFLPAAGFVDSTNAFLAGKNGSYYASTIYQYFPSDARSLYFSSGMTIVSSESRFTGCSLRPVYVENTHVTGVSLDSRREYLYVGDEVLLVATITPSHAYDKGIKWSSSNSSSAVVDNIGRVKAVGAGTAVITANTNEGGYTASCEVSVSEYVAVTGISLNASHMDINLGESKTLAATVTPSNASQPSVKWSSSDSDIAEVNSYSGKVTGKSTGTAIVTATVTDGGLTATCEVTVKKVGVTGISLDKTKMTLNECFAGFLKATVEPSNAYDKSFTWSSSDSSVATVDAEGMVSAVNNGTTVITAKTNDGGHTASCTVTVRKFPTPEAVDLGLSVKWASCNLGASTPEESGDYYAWGEIEPYYYSGEDPQNPSQRWKPGRSYGYDYSSYTWAKGSNDKNTKYCIDSDYGTVDNKTVLEPADDAAHVMLGDRWRMPTVDEFRELLNNCSYGKTQYNGVDGWLLTSNKNGKKIFLPAAGDRYITNIEGVGEYFGCWSSSLHPSYGDCAYILHTPYTYLSLMEIYYSPRCGGNTIRAVYD